MPEDSELIVKAKLADGSTMHVEAIRLEDRRGAEEEVVDLRRVFDFDDVRSSIESISKAVMDAVDKVKPSKAKVEFGIDVGVESGQLTGVLVKGSGKANLKITLEWG